jgi:signal transduction histidine kinase
VEAANTTQAEARRTLALLNEQVLAARLTLTNLRQEMAQAQLDFSEMQGAQLLEANENLVLAALRAESIADTAVSDLDELARSSERDAMVGIALDSAQIGEWEFDLATGATRRSIRHDRCFGHDQLQPTWTFDTFLQQVYPDDRDEVVATFEDAAKHGTDWHADCRVVWPDASIHWIAISGRTVIDGEGPGRMVGIVVNTTDQKVAEENRLKAQHLEAENRQILEASRLKNRFLSNMSHELRTPLNAVLGFAQLLSMDELPLDSPTRLEYTRHISSSGQHLLNLINDVLDMTRIESGMLQFTPTSIDLQAIIDEVCGMQLPALQAGQLSLAIEVDPTLTGLVIDPLRLKQVLHNYLSNAIKFTPQGGKVTVRAQPEGPMHFRIEVEDTGQGIAPRDVPRLFVEFQQLDEGGLTRKHQGSGLGLAITRRLVEAQGGSVGLRSTKDMGSVFHAVLKRVNEGQHVET